MATPRAELSSIASSLTDLARRVTALADHARDRGDEELASELFTVERELKAALRRLERAASSNGRTPGR
jgi:hypothetical protein